MRNFKGVEMRRRFENFARSADGLFCLRELLPADICYGVVLQSGKQLKSRKEQNKSRWLCESLRELCESSRTPPVFRDQHPDLKVIEAASLHFMQALVSSSEATCHLNRSHNEIIITRRSMDGVLNCHNDLMKRLEKLRAQKVEENKSLLLELEETRAEVGYTSCCQRGLGSGCVEQVRSGLDMHSGRVLPEVLPTRVGLWWCRSGRAYILPSRSGLEMHSGRAETRGISNEGWALVVPSRLGLEMHSSRTATRGIANESWALVVPVGMPRRIRITPPGEAAEEQKQYRETINTIHINTTIECLAAYLAGNSCLAPIGFVKKTALHDLEVMPTDCTCAGSSHHEIPRCAGKTVRGSSRVPTKYLFRRVDREMFRLLSRVGVLDQRNVPEDRGYQCIGVRTEYLFKRVSTEKCFRILSRGGVLDQRNFPQDRGYRMKPRWKVISSVLRGALSSDPE
ncbi:hypothetical protein F511_13207 [Dorcoceras hygrometricum]|uniref:Uncharacterized protein n=1 Tax=Dorcoceras hygrometricum TaxID=472368 RepID=A0A2Z7AH97_9LAMI|nr:hypothetical protein F511_13207 [Dorcoceras hygrometricum]